ncbi:MAG TPA: hypothetical protein VEA37_04005, partial [Flavobacterium sp.]|nr:hypothetical protein [Flavobacterium sp.]
MKIDILKSKEKLRVVRRDNHINSFIDNIFYLLVICIYPFIAVSELTKGLNRGTVTEWMVLLVIVA